MKRYATPEPLVTIIAGANDLEERRHMKRYQVIGPYPVLGCSPGGTIDASLEIEHERRLIDGGHLRPVESDKPASKPKGQRRAKTEEA